MYIHLDPQSIISDSICRCYIHLSVLSYNHGWTMTHAQDTCSAIPRYPASIYTSRCKSIHLRLLQLSAPTSFPSNGWLSSCGKWKSRYWRKLPEFEPGKPLTAQNDCFKGIWGWTWMNHWFLWHPIFGWQDQFHLLPRDTKRNGDVISVPADGAKTLLTWPLHEERVLSSRKIIRNPELHQTSKQPSCHPN